MAVSQINQNSLASGVPSSVASAALPVGSVLQVVNATTTTQVSSSTNTYVDTTLTATITPKFATSKILILVSQNGVQKNNGNAINMVDIIIVRNGAGILPQAMAATLGETGTALQNSVTASCSFLDSPATTSALTYKTQFASRNNTASVFVQWANVSTSFITLLEIAA
jgi:glutamine amidotransferase PdxT